MANNNNLRVYINAQDAFQTLYSKIMTHGTDYRDTKTIFNECFTIMEPQNNMIETSWRKWNPKYAEREWQWYLSKDRSIETIAKYAPIWYKMANKDGLVNSNYGYLWNMNNQLNKVVDLIKEDKYTRRAVITLYDGKDLDNYEQDTPCTLNVQFYMRTDYLCMTVFMRSNDLVLGFCNDQYCFSKLLELVANKLEVKIGTYTHFATNMHIYKQHFNLKTV